MEAGVGFEFMLLRYEKRFDRQAPIVRTGGLLPSATRTAGFDVP